MTCTVLASQVQAGKKKSDGSPYRFCRLWISLDDGSATEIVSRNGDYHPGDTIEVAVVTRFGNLALVPSSDL